MAAMCLILFYSCDDKTRLTDNETKPNLPKITIEDYFNIDTNYYCLSAQTLEDEKTKLKLPCHKLTDSDVEIRMWRAGVFRETKVLVLKYCKTIWQAKYGEMQWISNKVISFQPIEPNISWNNFSDSVINYDINNIENFTEYNMLDGYCIYIEISTKHSYHIIECSNPDSYYYTLSNKPKQFMKFYNFYNFINNCFDDALRKEYFEFRTYQELPIVMKFKTMPKIAIDMEGKLKVVLTYPPTER